MLLGVNRGVIQVEMIPVDQSSLLTQEINGRDTVSLTFEATTLLQLLIGDYITVWGRDYYLNTLPDIQKISSIRFKYTCTFESQLYQLSKVQYLNFGETDFALMGNLQTFVDLIITNLNRLSSGWLSGTVKYTDYRNLLFSGENCLEVLQRLCTEFDVQFRLSGKTIDITTIGTTSGISIQYGKLMGAYELTRKTVSGKNIITRLYPYGAERNIPNNYRNYAKRLMIGNLGANYIEEHTDKYGYIEETKTWDEIYPHREGTIDLVDPVNFLKFEDSDMDFDLNSYLIQGLTAKIHFNTGNLAGYEFAIESYNHGTREFTIIEAEDEKAYTLPNDTIKPAVGDSYVILDITLPVTYVTTAETELLEAATQYLSQNSSPRVAYELEVDPLYVAANGITFTVGDFVHVKDYDLAVDREIRIVQVQRNLVDENVYKIELSDEVVIQVTQRLTAAVNDLARIIRFTDLKESATALKRRLMSAEELRDMIYDEEGYFDTENIKPNSIETQMLAVGTKNGQFVLSGLIVQPNFDGDPAKCEISAAVLVHLTLNDTLPSWNLSASSYSGLTAGTAYYFYARCDRTGSGGTTILSSIIHNIDEGFTYYYFLLGVLHSVVSGVRDISLTYGHTRINGRFVTTGRITSGDGNTYFDLDTGKIHGAIEFEGGQKYSDIDLRISGAESTAGTANINANAALAASAGIAPSDDNLELRYTFDQDGISQVADESDKRYTGTIYGTKATHWDWVTGIKGKAFRVISPTSGYVQAFSDGTGYLNKQIFTISAWVRFYAKPGSNGNLVIYSYDYTSYAAPYYSNHFRLEYVYTNDTARVSFGYNIAGVVKAVQKIDIPWNSFGLNWHHVAITWVTGSQNLYLDGVLVASATESGTITYYAQEVWIGKMNTGPTQHPIVVDDVRYYSRVLSPNEILGLYKGLGNASSKTTIDGGIVTTGNVILKGADTYEKAGITAEGTDTSVRIWAGDTYANRSIAPFRVTQGGVMYSISGTIGGWTLASDAIYSGTKSIADGFASSGFTLAANGSIHAPNFFLNSNGSLGIRSSSSGKRVEINSTLNNIRIYNDSGLEVLILDDTIDGAAAPGMRAHRPTDYSDFARFTYLGCQVLESSALKLRLEYVDGVSTFYLPGIAATAGTGLKYLYIDPVTGKVTRAT